jgi:hypothetical protein
MLLEHASPPPDSALIRRSNCAVRLRQLRRQRRLLFAICMILLSLLTGFTVWMVIDGLLAMRSPEQQLPSLLNVISSLEAWTLVSFGLSFACTLAVAFSALVAIEGRIARVADKAEDFPDPKTRFGESPDPWDFRAGTNSLDERN